MQKAALEVQDTLIQQLPITTQSNGTFSRNIKVGWNLSNLPPPYS